MQDQELHHHEISDQDWELIICRCEEISRGAIINAINNGARTVEEIRRETRAGMGLCQTKTCLKAIQRIITETLALPMSDSAPYTFRPPTRPLSIETLASLDDEVTDK